MISYFTDEASARTKPRSNNASRPGEPCEERFEDLQTVPGKDMAPDVTGLVLRPMEGSRQ